MNKRRADRLKGLPNVVVVSAAFRPSQGGIERVSEVIAQGLRNRGFQVKILTSTPAPAGEDGVVRQPSIKDLMGVLRWSDVVLESNPSYRLSWPLALRIVRRPRMVVLHTVIGLPNGRIRLLDRLKRGLLPTRSTYTVSDWLRRNSFPRARLAPNPYDPEIFHPVEQAPSKDCVFVGRLVTAKGVDILLQAVSLLERPPTLTVVGAGPELDSLRRQAHALGIEVEFTGSLPPEGVAAQLQAHRVLVVPSRSVPPEAFPLVSLEGMACGCEVVVTDCGGLPETVGDLGIVVPPDHPSKLAGAIEKSLAREPVDRRRDEVSSWLRPYREDSVLKFYEDAILDLSGRRGP